MSKVLENGIKVLEIDLKSAIESADWHLERFKEYEKRILELKLSIQEIREVQAKL